MARTGGAAAAAPPGAAFVAPSRSSIGARSPALTESTANETSMRSWTAFSRQSSSAPKASSEGSSDIATMRPASGSAFTQEPSGNAMPKPSAKARSASPGARSGSSSPR